MIEAAILFHRKRQDGAQHTAKNRSRNATLPAETFFIDETVLTDLNMGADTESQKHMLMFIVIEYYSRWRKSVSECVCVCVECVSMRACARGVGLGVCVCSICVCVRGGGKEEVSVLLL